MLLHTRAHTNPPTHPSIHTHTCTQIYQLTDSREPPCFPSRVRNETMSLGCTAVATECSTAPQYQCSTAECKAAFDGVWLNEAKASLLSPWQLSLAGRIQTHQRGPAGSAGAAQEEQLTLLLTMSVFVYLYPSGLTMWVDSTTPFYFVVCVLLARGLAGKEGLGLLLLLRTVTTWPASLGCFSDPARA